ncbi:MAG: NAD-dependent epimerase/dehydratase family protein [Candidatus Omnitrophota bacterium]|nr:NAD-dependent epimerase/dehydratase family protein [Candidatus Omnitrophota bacterium]
MFKDKRVLVTGGTGLIGRPLVELLLERGAQVTIVSLDDPSRAHPKAEFIQKNLMYLNHCLEACEDMDYVFHLAGIKGSPAMTAKKPASFFVPTITFNTNMMEAARQSGVKRYLYTSTIGVYAPAEVFHEDDVWKTFPSEHDRFAGWAKRMGELQAEAYRIEYDWKDVVIVRPANVYGPYDNFDPENAMVIPTLIRRALDGENPLKVWGDGTAVRDFIHARDVARGMIAALEKPALQPVNLGSGQGVKISEIVEIISRNTDPRPEIEWDTSKPSGDQKRLMDTSRMRELGFEPEISIEDGIKEVMDWFRENRDKIGKRYNVFRKNKTA